jgi:BASS family bile acid:Na+ symporter
MKNTKLSIRFFLIASAVSFVLIPVLLVLGYRHASGPFVVAGPVLLAAFFTGHAALKRYAFTVWVFVFAAAAMAYPSAFGKWFGYDLGGLIVPLIQIIMFGMGTTLGIRDFRRIFVMPWPVLAGLLLQFTIMPFVGYGLAAAFRFEPEIAAGMVLIGSVPGGVASNLMTYLAGGNVALSVTMTSFSTLLSPVMTPFLMKVLAGKFVPIHFTAMMLSILDMIIVPIIAGLVANRILYGAGPLMKRRGVLLAVSAGCFLLTVVAALSRPWFWGPFAGLRNGMTVGLILVGMVALIKWIAGTVLGRKDNWMDKILPLVSMAGICLIIAIITARSSEKLISVGPALLAAVILHNSIGYTLAYFSARVMRLNERDSRAVSFEVGMQNGGMASGLAMGVLASPSAALAPAIFGPWQNISGSVLATWWNRKPIRDPKQGGFNATS